VPAGSVISALDEVGFDEMVNDDDVLRLVQEASTVFASALRVKIVFQDDDGVWILLPLTTEGSGSK